MAAALSAQLQERMVKVNVVPDHVDWKYELGEKVKFNVVVTKNRVPQENVTVWYEVAQDMMHPLLKDTIVLENGVLTRQRKKPGVFMVPASNVSTPFSKTMVSLSNGCIIS